VPVSWTDGRTKQKLTPCSTVTLQKLTVAQLLTIYTTSCVNRRIVSTFKTAHHSPLPGVLRHNPRLHVNFCKIYLDIIRPPAAKPSPQISKQKFVSSFLSILTYRGADKSLAQPRRKKENVSVRMAWISSDALRCRGKKNLMTARVSMLLKSRASLTCC